MQSYTIRAISSKIVDVGSGPVIRHQWDLAEGGGISLDMSLIAEMDHIFFYFAN
jgi:hypothetical protein